MRFWRLSTTPPSPSAWASSTHFDYIQGRVLKIEFDGDNIDPRLYDRDNGHGAALRAVGTVRAAATRAA